MESSKGFKFHRLMFRYFRIMLFSLGIPMTILTVAVIIMIFYWRNNEFDAQNAITLDKAASYMDDIWLQTQKISTQTSYDRSILKFFYLENREKLSISMLDRLNEVFGYIRAVNNANPLTAGMTIVAFSPDYYISSAGAWSRPLNYADAIGVLYPYDLIDSLKESDESDVWRLFKGDMSYYKTVIQSKNAVGCIFQRCDSVKISEAVREILQADRRIYMIDGDGIIWQDSHMGEKGRPLVLSEPNISDDYRGLFTSSNGKPFDASNTPSAISGFRYVMLWDRSGLLNYILHMRLIGSCVVLAVLMICAIVSYRFAQTVCRPYLAILDLLRKPTADALDNYEFRYARYDELGMIYTLINQAKYQTLTMQNELEQRKQALREAQHIALQAQINPHFMFNTLEAINYRVFEKLPLDREITVMIQDLSMLLRLSLETDNPLITVDEEIKQAMVYLRIQKTRLDGAFEVEWNINDSIRQMTMLRLCLQPLFENSISHGIKKLDSGGKIIVNGRAEGDTIVFSVIDNGPGFDTDTLARIRQDMVDSRWLRSSNIGLINVNTRLQLLFGVEYGISIESVPYKRTAVNIVMPIKHENWGDVHVSPRDC